MDTLQGYQPVIELSYLTATTATLTAITVGAGADAAIRQDVLRVRCST
jgi:hypothetical protein